MRGMKKTKKKTQDPKQTSKKERKPQDANNKTTKTFKKIQTAQSQNNTNV